MITFKQFLRGLGIVYLGVLGGLAANFWIIKNPNSTPVQMVTKQEKIYIEENTAFTDVVKDMQDSVIGVRTATINGSGLLLTSDGLAVTLAQNVPQGTEANILCQDKDKVSYQVLKRDFDNNLALIKLDNKNTKTNGFIDPSNLKIGLRVFVISQLFDDKKEQFFTSADEGIIKSFNEEVIRTNITSSDNINGSPVFNVEGRIVGLAFKDSGLISIIPISQIRSFVGL